MRAAVACLLTGRPYGCSATAVQNNLLHRSRPVLFQRGAPNLGPQVIAESVCRKLIQAKSVQAVVSSPTSQPPVRGCAPNKVQKLVTRGHFRIITPGIAKEKESLIPASAAGKLDSLGRGAW